MNLAESRTWRLKRNSKSPLTNLENFVELVATSSARPVPVGPNLSISDFAVMRLSQMHGKRLPIVHRWCRFPNWVISGLQWRWLKPSASWGQHGRIRVVKNERAVMQGMMRAHRGDANSRLAELLWLHRASCPDKRRCVATAS